MDLLPTLRITERKAGWWLWDDTRGMNLSMGAPSRDEAIARGFEYYQGRLTEVETELRDLRRKVESFVFQFVDEDTDIDL